MKKCFITVTGVLCGAVAIVFAIGKIMVDEINKVKKENMKHLSLYMLMVQYVKVKQKDKNISQFLVGNGIKSVAIYGMNYVGERLYDELKNSEVDIRYGIDQNAENIYSEIDLLKPNEELQKVDAIIVTPISAFNSIENDLSKRFDGRIISIEEILYEI